MVFLGIIIAIIIAIIFGFVIASGYEDDNVSKTVIGTVGIIVSIIVALGSFGFYTIKSNEIGVRTRFGEVVEIVDDGLHWNFWLTHNTHRYSLSTQEITTNFESFSEDGQAVDTKLSVQYRLDATKAENVYITYDNMKVLENRFEAVITERAKSVFAERTAMTIVEERGLLSAEIQSRIQSLATNYYVTVTNVALVNINFTNAFEKSIEDKMIAEQAQLQAEYEKEQAIVKAQQEYEVALLDAQAREAQAQGEANALIAISQAEAESIRQRSIEVARMLGFNITTTDGMEYIDTNGKTVEEIAEISAYLMYVQYMTTWDGVLPEIITGDTTDLILPTQ